MERCSWLAQHPRSPVFNPGLMNSDKDIHLSVHYCISAIDLEFPPGMAKTRENFLPYSVISACAKTALNPCG